ncbi:Cystathionine beta-synthase [Diplonema papillatum]|nr:Cystathionine beta-synthase [Diplonema papillatum]
MTTCEQRDRGITGNVLDLVGNTPLVRLNRLPKLLGLECEVLAKCEFFNPGGSVKDRIGKEMVLAADRDGKIHPGDTLVEPTSGNTGIGMSLASAVKGYKMVVTMPEKMSKEKISVMRALGAEVIRTPNDAAWDAPNSHIGIAKQMAIDDPVHTKVLDQYTNEANPRAHYEGTATEILQQCSGNLDMIVMGTGTGGTLSGIAKKLKEHNKDITVVGVDPVGSILAEGGGAAGPLYQVEGIGYDFIPDVLDRSLVDEWVKTNDVESFDLARKIIRLEGLLVGGSSGSAMAGVAKAAKRLKKGQRCVVVFSDGIRNYLTKFVDDDWMKENDFLPGEPQELTLDAAKKRIKQLEDELKQLRGKI